MGLKESLKDIPVEKLTIVILSIVIFVLPIESTPKPFWFPVIKDPFPSIVTLSAEILKHVAEKDRLFCNI